MIQQQKRAKNGAAVLVWMIGIVCVLLLVVLVDWEKTPVSVGNSAKNAPREGKVSISKTCVGFENKEDLDKANSFDDEGTFKAFTSSRIARGKAHLFHAGDQGHVVDSGWTGTRQIIPVGSSGSYWINEECIRSGVVQDAPQIEVRQRKVPVSGFVELSKNCYAFKNQEDYAEYWTAVEEGEGSRANKEALVKMKKGKAVIVKARDAVLIVDADGEARKVAVPNPPGGTGGHSENGFWISSRCIK